MKSTYILSRVRKLEKKHSWLIGMKYSDLKTFPFIGCFWLELMLNEFKGDKGYLYVGYDGLVESLDF